MNKVFEIIVPTMYGDNNKPISTKHHRAWDSVVRSITGGLTILAVAKGQWVNKDDKKLYVERVIPVRIMCTEKQFQKIVKFSLSHYRQKAIMFYKISDEVQIQYS
jgi:hypothetical protein